MHSLLEPRTGLYVQQLVCTLHEAFDGAHFRAAWECIVERHPALRTIFHFESGGEPDQEVVPKVQCRIEERNWADASPTESERRLDAYLREDRRWAFALDVAPLWRLCLIRIAECDYRLVWTYHHALLDGRSRRLLLQELFYLYDAHRDGVEPRLEPPQPFEPYVRWWLAQDLERQHKYWGEVVKGFCGATPLPVEKANQVIAGSAQQDRHRTLQAELTEQRTSALRQLASAQEVTLNTLFQGAWALLESRYAGTDDVLFGATRACRNTPVNGTASIVGLLINTVPMRVAVPPSMVAGEWLQSLRSQWVAIRDHELASLAQIQALSSIPRGEPLFDSLVVFENFRLDSIGPRGGGAWAGRSFRLIATTNYPIVVYGYLGPRLLIELTYDTHRVAHATATRILEHLQNLLDAFVASPQKTLAEIKMLSASEQRELLVEWNPVPVPIPRDLSIPSVFEAQVNRAPGATALAFEGETWTYQELNTYANRLAHRLRGLGIGPEKPVAIFTERSPELVIAMLGIAKAGGAYVPLDPSYPKQRLGFMLHDVRAEVVVAQRSLLSDLPEHGAQIICLDDASALDFEPSTNPSSEVCCNHLAYIMYTSGSTGTPKGVLIEHRGVLRLVLDTNYVEITPIDCIAQVSNAAFDAATFEIWGALLNGAKLVMFPRDLTVDPERIARAFREQQITISFLTSQLFNHIVTAVPDAFFGLSCLLVGGDKVDPSHCRELLRGRAPRRLLNGYGPTETTTFATYYPIEEVPPNATNIPIGRPIANTRVLVLDAARQLAPIGAVGELYIGGEGVARGYLARPELTAERFIADPFSELPGARLYRTGDLVRWRSDGNLEFLGRLDHQVKLRGFRIELGEIESVLARRPQVQQALVLRQEDRQGEHRLVAYVVPRIAGDPPAAKDLRKYLREQLPEYMVPAAFVLLAQLPMSPTGKVDRQVLLDVAPPPQEENHSFVAPRTSAEERVTRILAELLGRDRVSMDDDFFGLGGDSMLAVQAVSRIRLELGVHLPLNTLFEAPTPAGLLGRLGAGDTGSAGNSKFDLTGGREPTHPETMRSTVPPQTPTETRLAELWCHHLGIGSVGIHDNFFDLGGHSLLAAQMVERIERVFGRRLALNVFWHDGGTIAGQAMLLTASDWAEAARVLVPIKPAGSKPNLFVVHTIGGNIFHYNALAKALHSEQPVIGLQARGADGSEAPRRKIEDIAADCIAAMRDRQPRGPYSVAGYSSGGLVAFEIARQLVAAGEVVGLLALLDSFGPHARVRKGPWRAKMNKIFHMTPRLLQERAYHAILHRLGLEHRRQLRQVGEAQRWAHWSYRARPYAGSAVVIAAQDSSDKVDDVALGWKRLINGAVRLHVVSATHGSLLQEPIVASVAAILQEELDSATLRSC